MRINGKIVFSVRFTATLDEIGAQAADGSRRALEQIANKIAADAKARVPVKTGKLRDSIEISYRSPSRGSFSASIGSRVPYAHRIERGFIGVDKLGRYYDTPARPFLTPARDAALAELHDKVHQAVNQATRQLRTA